MPYDEMTRQGENSGWITVLGEVLANGATPSTAASRAVFDFGHPAPRYDRDVEAASEELREALELEREATARTVREYDALELDEPVRVAHLHNYFGLGGAEWGIFSFASVTDPARCRHEVLVGRPASELVSWYPEHGLPVNVYQGDRLRADWLLQAVEQADIVEYTLPNVWEDYPTPPEHVGLVSTRVNCRPGQASKGLGRQPDLYIPLSPAAQYCLADVYPEVPRVVIPYGCEAGRRGVTAIRKKVRSRLDIPQSATVLIWCGRFGAVEKGLPLLQQAIEATDDAVWVVVGYWHNPTSPEALQWTEFATQHGVKWIADCQPWQVRDCYLAADIGVSTSSTEGLGITMQDAAAAGLPVVATDSGGSRHVVQGGVTGWLSESDKPDAFLANLRDMVAAGPETWRPMGKAGMELVKARFDPETMAKRRVVEYAHIAAARRRLRPPRPTAPLNVAMPSVAPVVADKPARVGFVFDRPAIGGLPWRAALTIKALAELGHEVALFYARNHDGPDLLPWIEAAGIECHLGSIADDLVKWQPEVVQIGWPPLLTIPEGPWQLVGWVGGPRAADHLRSQTKSERVHSWICVSEAVIQALPDHIKPRAVVIRNAIPESYGADYDREEVRAALQLGRHDFAVVWAGGRMEDPNKRLEDALSIVAQVPRMKLLVAGHVGASDGLVKKLENCQAVRFVPGLRPWEMPWLYAAADAYLQPSVLEGLSVAALEAACRGLPIVATPAGATEELLGDCGRMFSVGHIAGAVEALKELRDRPELRRHLGEQQRRAAKGFSWSNYVGAYSALYTDLAEKVRHADR